LINSHNLPQLAKTSFSSEGQEIERLKDISVCVLVREGHTLLLASDLLEESSKWPEAEDDSFLFNIPIL